MWGVPCVHHSLGGSERQGLIWDRQLASECFQACVFFNPLNVEPGLWSAPCKVQTKLRKNYLFRGTECHLEDTKSSKSSSRHLEHSPQQRLWCPVHHPSLLLSSWYAETMALLRSGSALLSQRWVFFSGIPVLSLLTTGISYLLQAYPV